MRPVADQLAIFVIEPGDEMVGIIARFLFRIADDHVHPQTVIKRAVVGGGALVDCPHATGKLVFGLGPHQVDVALRAAELQRVGGITAEIEQRTAILLIGPRRLGADAFEIVDLALEIDRVAGPGLTQDLHHLVAAPVAEGAVGDFARKIRTDDVQRQPALEHVIKCGDGAGQHDRLHFTATDGGKEIDPLGDRRATGDEAQRVLADLVGERGQRMLRKPWDSAFLAIAEQCSKFDRRAPSGTPSWA